MKKARLHNGKILTFPDDTPDDVIKEVVGRLFNSKKDKLWSSEQVKTVIDEVNALVLKSDESRSKINHFGPAIDDQNKIIQEQSKIFKEQLEIFKEGNKLDKENVGLIKKTLDAIAEKLSVVNTSSALKDIAKHIIILANNIEILAHESASQSQKITSTLKNNNKLMSDILDAQKKNNEIMSDLVKVMKKPKNIVRNKDREITRIELD